MKYKIGNKVRIKSIDWYNQHKDETDDIECSNNIYFYREMSKFCGKVMTISHVRADHYTMVEDLVGYWTDEMIEGLVEEETKPNIIEEAKTYWDSIKDAWICPNGYIFKDENDNIINATKIVLEKKKKEYPKTYLGCCDVLGIEDTISRGVKGYKSNLLDTFQKLLICRDAYWKLYGEKMGMGKPWKPDWNTSEPKYVIACTSNGIEKQWETTYCKGFAFPTEEMRDAFYENFKEEIEKCKELL